MIKEFKLLFFLISFFTFPLICHAIDFDCNDKYFSFIAQVNEDPDEPESSLEDLGEEKTIDPAQSFKLIGIYLLSNKPKALIKNELNADEVAREYGTGDFLDEGQTISISKILFKPTSRVELIDKDGLTYLMKPYSLDEEGSGVSKSNPISKVYPTYSSKTKSSSYYKSKNDSSTNKKDESTTTSQSTTTTTTTASQPSSAEATPPPQQTPPPSSIMALEQESTSSGAGTSATTPSNSESPPVSDQVNGLDVSRPANPFGE